MRLLEKDQAWDLVLMDLMMPVRSLRFVFRRAELILGPRRRSWADWRRPRQFGNARQLSLFRTLSFALRLFSTGVCPSSPSRRLCPSQTALKSSRPASVSARFVLGSWRLETDIPCSQMDGV